MPKHRNIRELLNLYGDYLLARVSKVRILGESGERELQDVFVNLSVVDQRRPKQHAEFLAMMDLAMRRRLNPFMDSARHANLEPSEYGGKETTRPVKPSELLLRGTKALITGAPGCGKTTLLKYLALQAQGKENHLVVWLELKATNKSRFEQAEEAAARAHNLILHELWLTDLRTQLGLTDRESKSLSQYWNEKFRTNEVTVLLDGFDEIEDETIERGMHRCIREFASALHDNVLLISTRPYAQYKLPKERLQELEIEPLNLRQIQAFLHCYYPFDEATDALLEQLSVRMWLQELLQVPSLLGFILRLCKENRLTDEPQKLYETIIKDLAYGLDSSK